MSAETSVTVVGAGATGGYLAAQLAKAGVSITLVARADSLRQIRSSGITLERPDGERETIGRSASWPRMRSSIGRTLPLRKRSPETSSGTAFMPVGHVFGHISYVS